MPLPHFSPLALQKHINKLSQDYYAPNKVAWRLALITGLLLFSTRTFVSIQISKLPFTRTTSSIDVWVWSWIGLVGAIYQLYLLWRRQHHNYKEDLAWMPWVLLGTLNYVMLRLGYLPHTFPPLLPFFSTQLAWPDLCLGLFLWRYLVGCIQGTSTRAAYYKAPFLFVKKMRQVFSRKKFPQPSRKYATETKTFLRDTPIQNQSEDEYKYSDLVEILLKRTLATLSNDYKDRNQYIGSLGVGIVGDWGSGKTSFMRLIQATNNDRFIQMEFKPWLHHGEIQILQDFLRELGRTLRPYDRRVHKRIEDYILALTHSGYKPFTRITKPLQSLWVNPTTTEQEFERLRQIILELPKPLLIFIDDVDRLGQKEIIEVFRIIRNTANFGNTAFIVGYDRLFLNRALQNLNSYKAEEYADKIFQIEFVLPSRNVFFNIKTLADKLYPIIDSKDYSNKDELAIHLWQYLDDKTSWNLLLNNLRTTHLLINKFTILFDKIGPYIKWEELVLFCLLQFKDIQAYNTLIHNQLDILEFDPQNKHYTYTEGAISKFSPSGQILLRNLIRFDLEKSTIPYNNQLIPVHIRQPLKSIRFNKPSIFILYKTLDTSLYERLNSFILFCDREKDLEYVVRELNDFNTLINAPHLIQNVVNLIEGELESYKEFMGNKSFNLLFSLIWFSDKLFPQTLSCRCDLYELIHADYKRFISTLTPQHLRHSSIVEIMSRTCNPPRPKPGPPYFEKSYVIPDQYYIDIAPYILRTGKLEHIVPLNNRFAELKEDLRRKYIQSVRELLHLNFVHIIGASSSYLSFQHTNLLHKEEPKEKVLEILIDVERRLASKEEEDGEKDQKTREAINIFRSFYNDVLNTEGQTEFKDYKFFCSLGKHVN